MTQADSIEDDGRLETTVVVVGAGLAGLSAARELHRQGVDVIVLESADRLGGRALTETTALGSRVDLGGQWIGHDHQRVKSLAAELDVPEFRMRTTLLATTIRDRRPVGVPSILAAGVALGGVEVLSRFPSTERWNSTPVSTWLAKVPGRTVRRLLEVAALISWTADLDRLSVHAMATAIRSQGGLRTMLTTQGGAQESLLLDGVGGLIDGIADELGPRVRTGRRVTSIVQGDGHTIVRTTRGDVRASKVILTVPPPLIGRITFDPPLPPAREALCRNTYMGSVYKAIGVYDRPFWRDRNDGECIVLDPPGRAVFDTSPPGGPGHLCVLVGGPDARELDHLDPDARRTAVFADLVDRLGPEILEPVSWHEKSWHLDDNVGGAYMAIPVPGTTEGLMPIDAAPIGDIHWAGTETAGHHPGYLDGAIESGLRVAQEVGAVVRASLDLK